MNYLNNSYIITKLYNLHATQQSKIIIYSLSKYNSISKAQALKP